MQEVLEAQLSCSHFIRRCRVDQRFPTVLENFSPKQEKNTKLVCATSMFYVLNHLNDTLSQTESWYHGVRLPKELQLFWEIFQHCFSAKTRKVHWSCVFSWVHVKHVLTFLDISEITVFLVISGHFKVTHLE